VGPGALRHLQDRSKEVPLLFGMVLNPDKLLANSVNPPCGVSLNLSITAQIAAIASHLPDMTRLGVLFDPVNNQPWFERATVIASSLGVELVPLRVTRQGERIKILDDLAAPDAILFIPDKTIIAKPVIRHIIKQAVFQQTPVVGYNQFFYDSGAALSFVIDYAENGQQVARQVETILAGDGCPGVVAPAFTTRVNEEVLRILRQDGQGGGL
ncbi:MAG: ABC transporter substrate binding protein, partial [Thermodesulfobacteriota bacterium]|nr:ABC transporter substrate binding protein [Thermodesulfobacteriota bacterium]